MTEASVMLPVEQERDLVLQLIQKNSREPKVCVFSLSLLTHTHTNTHAHILNIENQENASRKKLQKNQKTNQNKTNEQKALQL